MIRKLLLFMSLVAISCFAADITTRDGNTTYRNAQVTGVDPDGIRVTHSTGVAKLRFENLPDALQKHYHYDPAKVAAYRKQVEDAQKAASAKAAAAEQQRQRDAQQAQEVARHRAKEQRKLEQERIDAENRQKALEEIGRVIGIIIAFCIGVLLYFLPSVIGRHKTNAVAILIFNLFLGWTFLGWVLALVWACTKDSAMDSLARERMAAKGGPRYLE